MHACVHKHCLDTLLPSQSRFNNAANVEIIRQEIMTLPPQEKPATVQHPTSHTIATDEGLTDGREGCDAGLRAWTVVLGAWCAMIPSMGLLNTLAVLEAWIAENELQHVPKSTTGWIFSCYAFFLYFGGAQVGPVFDAYGVRALTIPGSVGIVAALIFLSFSTGESQSDL